MNVQNLMFNSPLKDLIVVKICYCKIWDSIFQQTGIIVKFGVPLAHGEDVVTHITFTHLLFVRGPASRPGKLTKKQDQHNNLM